MMKNKAVVLGTNYYIGLSIVRNLGRNDIHVVTMDYEPSKYGVSRYVEEALLVPHYEKEEAALVQYMVDFAKEQEAKPVLFLSSDPYVHFLDRNFDLLKEFYLFPMEQKGLLSDLMDKETLLKFTEEYNIPTPEIIDIHEENFYERVLDEIGFPCLIKPRDSAEFVRKFREKAFRIRNEEELKAKLALLGDSDDVFIQRIIPGPESNCYSADCYYGPDSALMGFVTTEKIRQWPNNFGASTYAKQKWIPELIPLVHKLFQGIQYRGFAEVELKRDEFTNVVYLIEINVRFINFTEMLCALGFNTPLVYYRDSIGEPIPKKYVNYDTNVHWKYKYEDISAIFGYLNSGQMSLMRILVDYKFRKVSSTWAWDDPGPGLSFTSHAIKKAGAKLLKKIKRK
ncbi:carboxylate--amine ligase [Peptoniphilus sp. KCTC 25270]|uniref:carboxylate--amine ligase n=1 Tax=Peptoniphilus sp. KCTC 25270 TaxID=2897414 RepID=UPI001E50C993|nr:carboxylate--amine ligase [Peptoniphilus sp. KCTC 25270]MCD1147738.1 carboxylate--amine ligase [Peptoniphilus sp. KCTC 25270]